MENLQGAFNWGRCIGGGSGGWGYPAVIVGAFLVGCAAAG
jgi:hypothetical protein